MRRYTQTLTELIDALSPIAATWEDDHSKAVIKIFDLLPLNGCCTREQLGDILDIDFRAGMTAIRLALELSKDEFEMALRTQLEGAIGVKRYRTSRDEYLDAIEALEVSKILNELATQPVTCKDLLIERLKAGRGAAIKGQSRGRLLEDFTESVVSRVFGNRFDTRCRFLGSNGSSTEKADFAIPASTDPRILIEVKAYGATGSKQTDILGDISRIVHEKRHDTHLLLVTDGVAWKARQSDLRRLVLMQNDGRISRIYTSNMEAELEADLRQLRSDHHLHEIE